MSELLVAYISTAKPWRPSNELRKIHRKKLGYGIRVHFRGEILSTKSWVSSTQPVLGQMLALECLVCAVVEADLDVDLRVILRTDYLRQRLEMAGARSVKAQKGRPRRPMKEDEERWRQAHSMWQIAKGAAGGMRPFDNDSEEIELSYVEDEVLSAFTMNPSPFSENSPPSPELAF